MTEPKHFKEFLESRGVSLSTLGLQDRALLREDALHAVELAGCVGVGILGGDVYVDKRGQLESAYANWYTEQREGEVQAAFVARSCRESKAYISAYPEPHDGVPVFVLVAGDEGEG